MDRKDYSELQTFLCFKEFCPWTQRSSEDQLWLLRGCILRAGDSFRAPGAATTHQKYGCRQTSEVAWTLGQLVATSKSLLFLLPFLASLETGMPRLYAVPGRNEGLNLRIWGWLNHCDSLERCHQLKKKFERFPYDHFNHLSWQEYLK